MIIILMGPPGSGKGTQAVILSEKLKIPHVSTGNIFRHELSNNTPLGQKAQSYMDSGELVPDSVVTDMVNERISKEDCEEGYILDGFPRTIPQAESFESILKDKGVSIDYVFNLEVEDDILIKRLTGRMACEDCGKDFNTYSSPPKIENLCDVCEGSLVSRSDDNEETVKNRLGVYKQETMPLIEFYGDRVTGVEGKGTPQQTLDDILNTISS